MKSETYKIGDTVTYMNIVWRVEKDFNEQLFLRSGTYTASVFKSNRDLKLYDE